MLALVAVLAACAPAAPAPKEATGTPIKIGYLTPLTGRMGPYGHLQKLAVNLAVEDINKGGGINGHPIKIIMEDSAFDPKQAVALTRKLVNQEKVFAILGPFASGEFEVVAPLAVELKIPLIAGTTTKPGMSAANRPWAFRMTLTDDVSFPAGLDLLKRKYPNAKKVVIVGDTKESVTENMVHNIYPKYLKEKGFEILGTVGFETGTTDYSAIVTKIKGMNADAIAYASLPGNAIAFCKESARQELKTPMLVGPQLQPVPPLPCMKGWLMAGFLDENSTDPIVQKFMARFKAAGEADTNVRPPVRATFEPYIYDATMVLGDILRKNKITPDTPLDKARAAIRDGFQNLKGYRGVMGTYNMTADGDAITQPVPLVGDPEQGKWVRAE
jgi:branched-chain amino acid transport system substrate-binding protein